MRYNEVRHGSPLRKVRRQGPFGAWGSQYRHLQWRLGDGVVFLGQTCDKEMSGSLTWTRDLRMAILTCCQHNYLAREFSKGHTAERMPDILICAECAKVNPRDLLQHSVSFLTIHSTFTSCMGRLVHDKIFKCLKDQRWATNVPGNWYYSESLIFNQQIQSQAEVIQVRAEDKR